MFEHRLNSTCRDGSQEDGLMQSTSNFAVTLKRTMLGVSQLEELVKPWTGGAINDTPKRHSA